MKIKTLFPALFWLLAGLYACQSQAEYCTVKGTVQGVKDGTRLELEDAFNHFRIIATTRVKNGAYEFHPHVSAPTHVYLYGDKQLKDFFLEPGTIIADVDATDEMDFTTHATGTPSNDLLRKIDQLFKDGDKVAANALEEEILNAEETGVLALYYVSGGGTSGIQGLNILDRLSPVLAANPFVTELREKMENLAKTEPAPEGSDSANYYIDMGFPDKNGHLISLSSVVNNPDNRYVLLDFWATWCGPCRDEIPELKSLYSEYHGKGLEIYSVAEDPKGNEEIWKSFMLENGMTWVNVRDVDYGPRTSKVWSEYGLSGIPTLLLIDGETGAILFRSTGKVSRIETVLSSLLP